MGSYGARDENAEECFDRLFRAYYSRVLAYALRRASADAAHDVAAETFLVAWRRLNRLPKDPLPWLLGIARKTLANQRRGQRRRNALVSELSQHGRSGVVAETAEMKLTLGEIAAALERLSDADREILELIAWEGLEVGEAAQVLGVSAGTARVRLHRARRRLTTKLEAQTQGGSARDPFPALAEELR